MREQGPKQSDARNSSLDVLTYAWRYQNYVDVLTTDSENLKARLSDVQREVNEARSKQQVIKPQVVKWLDDGNKELKLTDTFLGSLGPQACWKLAWECNWKRRFTVAKRAITHSNQINKLMEICSFEGRVSPPLTPTMPSRYKAIPSREKYLGRIMEALIGGDKLVIGLYGTEGVGKTTLVKKLALAIESSGVFSGIGITTARNRIETNVGLLQGEIAWRTRLTYVVDPKSPLDDANALCGCLKSMRKVVIIIDHLDKWLDLNKVGIPWPENNNDCRIVVVSKSLDVCKEMKTHMNLEIESLCQEEALQLFDELTKVYNFADTTKLQKVRDGLLSKFLWTPREIKALLHPFREDYYKLLPADSMVATDEIAKKTLMLGAEALGLGYIYDECPQTWRWLTPSPTSSLNVAELIVTWYGLDIAMTVREDWLSPATNYGAYLVYQLLPHAEGFKVSNTPMNTNVGSLRKSCYLDPFAAASKTLEGGGIMPKRRKDGWLEIELGNFFNVGRSGIGVQLLVSQFTLSRLSSGLLVQGFELRPLD